MLGRRRFIQALTGGLVLAAAPSIALPKAPTIVKEVMPIKPLASEVLSTFGKMGFNSVEFEERIIEELIQKDDLFAQLPFKRVKKLRGKYYTPINGKWTYDEGQTYFFEDEE